MIKNYHEIIQYAIGLSILLLVLKWIEIQFLVIHNEIEIYIGLIAFIFLFLGIWIANKLITKTKPQYKLINLTSTAEAFVANEKEIKERRISKRELEVIILMARGFSNQEIADRLFVSLNTIKTHNKNLFEKLDSKRRIQAIETAKNLHIIPYQ